MITLHGTAASRASRSLLALEELGLAYQHVPLAPWSNAEDAPKLARINPNARVPVLDDDGLILWESMAINLYLGDRYGSAPLWPDDRRDRALAERAYLLGDAFTLGDLNLAATLSEPWERSRVDGELDPADHGLSALADWLSRCTSRDSWERVRGLA